MDIRDRALGTILACAAGDALGASYEFQPAIPASEEVILRSYPGGTIGEWTDDTAMTIAILLVAARQDISTVGGHGAIVRLWLEWARTARDIGIQTRKVFKRTLSAVEEKYGTVDSAPDAELARICTTSATQIHFQEGKSGGNGSLMRTAPVALTFLDNGSAMAETARAISALTHYDPQAGDACVLWTAAIARGIISGSLDFRAGIESIPASRRAAWEGRIAEAESHQPGHFTKNSWVIHAFQASVSALHRTSSLTPALEAAVRAGNDTDTVAAITGQLAGAVYGASAVPLEWRRALHGWPCATEKTIESLVCKVLSRGGL